MQVQIRKIAFSGGIAMENIIEVQSLEKIFANQTALEDVNFHVKKGEIFGFLGPSGSGKTTTIKILTGQLNQTSGKATVFGEPVSGMKKGDPGRKSVYSPIIVDYIVGYQFTIT